MHKTRREAFGSIRPSSVEAVNPQVAANEPTNLDTNTQDFSARRDPTADHQKRHADPRTFCCPPVSSPRQPSGVFDKRSTLSIFSATSLDASSQTWRPSHAECSAIVQVAPGSDRTVYRVCSTHIALLQVSKIFTISTTLSFSRPRP